MCTHKHAHTQTYAHKQTCTHTNTHARTHTHTHTNVHTHARMHTHAHTHVHAHKHILYYTYIHTDNIPYRGNFRWGKVSRLRLTKHIRSKTVAVHSIHLIKISFSAGKLFWLSLKLQNFPLYGKLADHLLKVKTHTWLDFNWKYVWPTAILSSAYKTPTQHAQAYYTQRTIKVHKNC